MVSGPGREKVASQLSAAPLAWSLQLKIISSLLTKVNKNILKQTDSKHPLEDLPDPGQTIIVIMYNS